MISLHNNERLKELGFRMLIPVHDEIIAECPEENLKECAELLAQTMSDAAARILDMPINCDVACSYQWYGEEISL
jgi:DNA polymerase-1